jgi:glycine oxidase
MLDYLIIGQGIAGTMLAYFLQKRGKSIHIVDEYNPSSSSHIASGLFNPITGRRLVKTWKADYIFPFAEKTYHELEEILDNTFYYKKNVLRVFPGQQEQIDWMKKADSAEFKGFILKDQWTIPKVEDNSFGGIEITQSGYLDMALFVSAFREKMLLEDQITEERLQYQDIHLDTHLVRWKEWEAKKIIFCEGYQTMHNPFFSWLPFVPAKGEIITIYSEDLKLDKILSKGIFILPIGKQLYKVGATYSWNFPDDKITEDGKNELCKKLERLTHCSYRIVDHKAGIRPTVKDRRPFLGLHPEYPNIGIFNGMGTKGASLAPFFAHSFAEFLEDGKPLDKEVEIGRYYNLKIF